MDQKTTETILRVVNRVSPKYCHDINDLDDLKQEAYLACVYALPSFDPEKGGLESFLARSATNKLLNIIKRSNIRRICWDTVSIHTIETDCDLFSYEELRYNDSEDLKNMLDEFPPNMRKDYLKMIGGVSISPLRKQAIYDYIKENISAEI